MKLVKWTSMVMVILISTNGHAALITEGHDTVTFDSVFNEIMAASKFSFDKEISPTNTNQSSGVRFKQSQNDVPVPAAVWLFASGLVGLISLAKRKKSSKYKI